MKFINQRRLTEPGTLTYEKKIDFPEFTSWRIMTSEIDTISGKRIVNKEYRKTEQTYLVLGRVVQNTLVGICR